MKELEKEDPKSLMNFIRMNRSSLCNLLDRFSQSTQISSSSFAIFSIPGRLISWYYMPERCALICQTRRFDLRK